MTRRGGAVGQSCGVSRGNPRETKVYPVGSRKVRARPGAHRGARDRFWRFIDATPMRDEPHDESRAWVYSVRDSRIDVRTGCGRGGERRNQSLCHSPRDDTLPADVLAETGAGDRGGAGHGGGHGARHGGHPASIESGCDGEEDPLASATMARLRATEIDTGSERFRGPAASAFRYRVTRLVADWPRNLSE